MLQQAREARTQMGDTQLNLISMDDEDGSGSDRQRPADDDGTLKL
jgi:hypothetical protein